MRAKGVGAFAIVFGILAVAFWVLGESSPPRGKPAPTPAVMAIATNVPTPRPTLPPTATAQPVPTVTPVPAGTLPVTMRVPKMGIRAKVVTLGVNPDGTMASPDGPDPVGWYNFSGLLGTPGNAVFAGHVDWHTGVTGVFWLLRDLRPGDTIFITGQDGVEYSYAVTTTTLYSDDKAPLFEIVGPRPGETITLITCEGVFDSVTRNYDQRRVVIAERQIGSAPAPHP